MRFLIKTNLLNLILVLTLLLNPAGANDSSDTSSSVNEYFIVANNKTHLSDNIFNDNVFGVPAEDTLVFRILDNTSKKFTISGVIKLEKLESKPIPIEQHNFKEYVKDILQGVWSQITGGESTSGNNSEYYAEYPFAERTENYQAIAIGEYNSTLTKNKIIINVRTKYITKNVGNSNKTYQLASMNDLSRRKLKYHSINHGQNAEELIKNINEFLSASNELQNKIGNLTNNPKETIDGLPVNDVLGAQKKVEDSKEKFSDAAMNDVLIEKSIPEQLSLITKDSSRVMEELTSNLNSNRGKLLKDELELARKSEEDNTITFIDEKSKFKKDVFIPAGVVVIILGLIIGYFNVNRWKKESEYFGLYTSRANITSPITIAIILTVIISILVGIIVYIEGDLGMFKFLI